MASMGGAYLDPEPTARLVKTYVNKFLQQICVGEGMSKFGVKAELQNRIIDRLREYAAKGDVSSFQSLQRIIQNAPHAEAHSYTGMASSLSSIHTPATPSGYLNNGGGSNIAGGSGYRIIGHPRIEFKSTPFYVIEEQLGDPAPCETMQHHRHTVKIPLRVSDHPILARVLREPTLRVMVFCAGEGHGRHDITFPHQSEIKVNGGEVKANLRGLKNKPGSTRPVDITKELRLNLPAYSNSVEMTYALTNKKYFLIIYVVKAIPVTDLVKRLENGKRITEKSVVDDMVNKARDADIVATATVLSLKCPLSTLRIELPCRSIACKHNQCFDATSYLQLQEQGPTWLCPICNNSAPFDTLAVDEYVRDILKNTPKSIDQVTVQPDGKWELHTRKENPPISKQNGVGSDSDDSDIVEITKSGDSVRMSTHRASNTPVLGQLSRSSSIAARPSGSMGGSNSGKRPAAVIDLTSSGDEDEEPIVRAPKRQQTNGFQPISIPAYRPGPPNGVPPHRI